MKATEFVTIRQILFMSRPYHTHHACPNMNMENMDRLISSADLLFTSRDICGSPENAITVPISVIHISAVSIISSIQVKNIILVEKKALI